MDWPAASRPPSASSRSPSTPSWRATVTRRPVSSVATLLEWMRSGLGGSVPSSPKRRVMRVLPDARCSRTAAVMSTAMGCEPFTVIRFNEAMAVADAVTSPTVTLPFASAWTRETCRFRSSSPESAMRSVPAAVPLLRHSSVGLPCVPPANQSSPLNSARPLVV